jgi:hypothetical protein
LVRVRTAITVVKEVAARSALVSLIIFGSHFSFSDIFGCFSGMEI